MIQINYLLIILKGCIMKKIALAIIALTMLSACSSTTNMDPWIGRGEDEVIARLGLPIRVYKSHDKKYMIYNMSQTNTSARWLGLANDIYTVSECGYVAPVSSCNKTKITRNTSDCCQTVFILDGNGVESWTTVGDCGY